jgi:hypothetical protein
MASLLAMGVLVDGSGGEVEVQLWLLRAFGPLLYTAL